MPKSKGRKPKKAAGRRRHGSTIGADRPGKYDVGRLRGSNEHILKLLSSADAAPDLIVELLPPMLWLSHMHGKPANRCVDGCMILHYAYEQLGIIAQPRAVDLVVSNQRTEQRTFYGRPDPNWRGTTFNGHCVLWLPGSRRLLDATVEQYPEIRRYRLGPICGRAVPAQSPPEHQEAAERGELLPGAHIAIKREGHLLLYTAADHRFDRVVVDAEMVRQTAERYKRAGANLASHALGFFRLPEVAERVRQAPYPRLHALLDLLSEVEATVDENHDYRFSVPGPDGTVLGLRLDELTLPDQVASPAPVAPLRPTQMPQASSDPADIREIMDDVTTEARALFSSVEGADSELPTLIFEPHRAVAIRHRDGGPVREAQAEGIIAAGFARFLPKQQMALPELSKWSTRRTSAGLELWDEGGIWARAQLDLDEEWRVAADRLGACEA